MQSNIDPRRRQSSKLVAHSASYHASAHQSNLDHSSQALQYHHQSSSSVGNSSFSVGASFARHHHSPPHGLVQYHHQSNHYQQYASSYPQRSSPELRSSPTVFHQSRSHTSSSVGIPYQYPNENYINPLSPQQQLPHYSSHNNKYQASMSGHQYQPSVVNQGHGHPLTQSQFPNQMHGHPNQYHYSLGHSLENYDPNQQRQRHPSGSHHSQQASMPVSRDASSLQHHHSSSSRRQSRHDSHHLSTHQSSSLHPHQSTGGRRSHQGPLQAPVDASLIQATLPRQRRRSNNDLPVHPHSDHYCSQHRY